MLDWATEDWGAWQVSRGDEDGDDDSIDDIDDDDDDT